MMNRSIALKMMITEKKRVCGTAYNRNIYNNFGISRYIADEFSDDCGMYTFVESACGAVS